MIEQIQTDTIRSMFSQAMSDMYRAEVPQYGALIDLVREVNAATLAADPALRARLTVAGTSIDWMSNVMARSVWARPLNWRRSGACSR